MSSVSFGHPLGEIRVYIQVLALSLGKLLAVRFGFERLRLVSLRLDCRALVLELLAQTDEERDVDRLEADDQRQQVDVQTEGEPGNEPHRVKQRRQRREQHVAELDADDLDGREGLKVVVVPID